MVVVRKNFVITGDNQTFNYTATAIGDDTALSLLSNHLGTFSVQNFGMDLSSSLTIVKNKFIEYGGSSDILTNLNLITSPQADSGLNTAASVFGTSIVNSGIPTSNTLGNYNLVTSSNICGIIEYIYRDFNRIQLRFGGLTRNFDGTDNPCYRNFYSPASNYQYPEVAIDFLLVTESSLNNDRINYSAIAGSSALHIQLIARELPSYSQASSSEINIASYTFDSNPENIFGHDFIDGGVKPIIYRLTNCTAPDAPSSAASGSEVTVNLNFTEGFAVNNPSTDAYVMNNGVLVPSTYSNGTLTFTMP